MNGPHTELQQAEPTDIADNKGMAILAYILFFVPLLAVKQSKYAMYHANQGLTLFLTLVVVNIVSSIIPIIGWLLIGPLANLCVFILAILGILNAAGGKCKPLPLIGGFRILNN
ncbi:DUF4870 domain-containing protein [Cohnella hongkongensis]|uniref:DUF4870 domain-containing protein n=1 Tax=Cohnella hongkongensis TaxID=178337 RepID=A0ABV9F862_9BACL